MSQFNILIRPSSLSSFCSTYLFSSSTMLSTNTLNRLHWHTTDGKALIVGLRDNNRTSNRARALSSCAIEKGALPSSSEVRSTHHRNTQEVARGQMVESEADHADSVASSVDELFPPARKTN